MISLSLYIYIYIPISDSPHPTPPCNTPCQGRRKTWPGGRGLALRGVRLGESLTGIFQHRKYSANATPSPPKEENEHNIVKLKSSSCALCSETKLQIQTRLATRPNICKISANTQPSGMPWLS